MGRCFYQDIAPTIRTRTDGANMDFIMEEVKETICLNSKVNGKQPSVADRIYSVEGCAVALTSGWKQNIAEPISVAMRGRNPNNPSERGKSNGNYKQRLEMNDSGTSNTTTSVQKDNLVVEPRIIEVGKVKQQDSVQHEDGICRTICTGHHASTPHLLKTMVSEPQVMTPKRTEFGKAVRKAYENKYIEMSRHDMTTMEPRTDGVSNTLTSVQKDNLVATPHYRIRKLTPRECFRLMGVDDADIDKLMSAGISNSQLYKCAGNSIVVDTLYHLFRKLFCDKESEEATYQQTLF